MSGLFDGVNSGGASAPTPSGAGIPSAPSKSTSPLFSGIDVGPQIPSVQGNTAPSDYGGLSAQYTAKKDAFDTSVKEYNTKRTAFEQESSNYEKNGGDLDEYTRLNSLARELNDHSSFLQNEQESLNAMVDPLNKAAQKDAFDKYEAAGGSVIGNPTPGVIPMEEKQKIEDAKLPFYTRAIDSVLDFFGIGKSPTAFTQQNPTNAVAKVPFSNRLINVLPNDTSGSGASQIVSGFINWPERVKNVVPKIFESLASGGSADTQEKTTPFTATVGNDLQDTRDMTNSLIDQGWSKTGAVTLSSLVNTFNTASELLPIGEFTKGILSKVAARTALSSTEHIALWEAFGRPDTLEQARTIRNHLLVDLGNQSKGLSTPEAAQAAAKINKTFDALETAGIPKDPNFIMRATKDLNALLDTDIKNLSDFTRTSKLRTFTPPEYKPKQLAERNPIEEPAPKTAPAEKPAVSKLPAADLVGEGKDFTQIESKVKSYVETNKQALIEEYTAKHGNIFNVDNMKDLIPGHAENRTLSEAFHKPAAELTGEMVENAIKNGVGENKEITFMGGAPAVGKSTMASKYGGKGITVDGTLADTSRSIDQMKLALKNGYDVSILYVNDKPENIIKNAVTRAGLRNNTGRTVPIETVYNALLRGRQNILRANGKFGQGEYGKHFTIKVIDKSSGTPVVVENGVDFLKGQPYSESDIAAFKKNAYDTIDKLHEQGKITTKQHQGFTRRREELAQKSESNSSGNDGKRPEERERKQLSELKTFKGEETDKEVTVPAYNTAAKNASIGLYNNEAPIEAAHLHDIKPIETPELVDLARELMGEVPQVKEKMVNKLGYFKPKGDGTIALRADMFSKENAAGLPKLLAHEIGHLVDYLPEKNLKRGNLLGRLRSLNKFMEATFDDGENVIKNKDVRKELIGLSQYWKPFDRLTSSENYVKYRDSGPELYADAISVLLNSPGTVEKMAPTFYKAFFDALDLKPEVKDAYFDIQARLNGDRSHLVENRREGVRTMFNEGDQKASDIQRERERIKKERDRNYLFRFKYELVDKNYALIDRVNKLIKSGTNLPEDENPLYYLEERSYVGGKQKALMEKYFAPVYKNLTDAHVSWTDFGEALFYRRIAAGDRSDVANPRGITPDAANELLETMERGMTEHQIEILNESIDTFREGHNKIIDEAYEEGMIKPDMYKSIKENPEYSTFRVIDHLEDNVTSRMYKSIGTLKDITNPADATIMKTLAVMRAVENQKSKRAAVDFLKKYYSDEIEPARQVFNGKGQEFVESKKEYQELVTLFSKENKGKMEGYYVDPYIQTALNNDSVGGKNLLVSALKFINGKLYRPLYIGFNPGFQAFNFIRDFQRFWQNTPKMTIPRALSLYYKSLPAAKVRAFGVSDKATETQIKAAQTIQDMEESQILSVTYNDLMAGESDEDVQLKAILHSSGIESFADEKKVPLFMKPIMHTLDFIKKTGDLIETLPKVAGYYEFTRNESQAITREQASFIRKNIGSPDFLAGGHIKPATNEIFLFSNAITQGIRSDLSVAMNPKTRSGYWAKAAKSALIPKIMMFLATVGAFGASVKQIMDGVSEYDKTNYTIVPIGIDENGKSIYLRLPPSEGNRLLSGLLWKSMSSWTNNQNFLSDMEDIVSYGGGQLPSVNPTIQNLQATSQFISGQNPYDFFRNRNILSDDVYKAGGSEALKQFAGWLFNQNGGSVFTQLYTEPTIPTPQSPTQRIFNLPVFGNIAGRFIRVSNYGITEKLKQAQSAATAADAQRRLDERRLVNGYISKYQAGTDTGKNLAQDMLDEAFNGKTPTTDDEIKTAKRLVDKFAESIKKGGGSPYITSLIDATSNNEKEALVRQARNQLTTDDYKNFVKQALEQKLVSETVVKNALNSDTPTYESGQKVNQTSFLDSVVTYAKAIGTDPETAFNRIVTGQRIRRIDNGAIIVERMPLAESEGIKKEQGGNNPTMKLDHTLPLQLGGSNARDNLKLVPTDVWASYTPIEDFLGRELRAKRITKDRAVQLITDFKQGKITAQNVLNYMNEKP